MVNVSLSFNKISYTIFTDWPDDGRAAERARQSYRWCASSVNVNTASCSCDFALIQGYTVLSRLHQITTELTTVVIATLSLVKMTVYTWNFDWLWARDPVLCCRVLRIEVISVCPIIQYESAYIECNCDRLTRECARVWARHSTTTRCWNIALEIEIVHERCIKSARRNGASCHGQCIPSNCRFSKWTGLYCSKRTAQRIQCGRPQFARDQSSCRSRVLAELCLDYQCLGTCC